MWGKGCEPRVEGIVQGTKRYCTILRKPEDHWSCKRSPDILILVKHKTYKTWKIYGKEMTLTFNTHIPS